MKPKKFKITNLNNFSDYIGLIPVVNSIATITTEDQLRQLERQQSLGDFKFEEIIEPEPKKETSHISKHNVEERSGNVASDIKQPAPAKANTKSGNSRRGRSKKQ